uniref:Uncharacterized protein n=1 Tax=Haptolina ericina TaxID=156174 RepID=A0A7S3AFX0_9EUKA|mmetsp:Transcript_16795/g.37661  ORF Transcript_16795/g.37661 Transcript_16795/m.37661 type:complete len:195 (+) Transcript_16795:1-585(+)
MNPSRPSPPYRPLESGDFMVGFPELGEYELMDQVQGSEEVPFLATLKNESTKVATVLTEKLIDEKDLIIGAAVDKLSAQSTVEDRRVFVASGFSAVVAVTLYALYMKGMHWLRRKLKSSAKVGADGERTPGCIALALSDDSDTDEEAGVKFPGDKIPLSADSAKKKKKRRTKRNRSTTQKEDRNEQSLCAASAE